MFVVFVLKSSPILLLFCYWELMEFNLMTTKMKNMNIIYPYYILNNKFDRNDLDQIQIYTYDDAFIYIYI